MFKIKITKHTKQLLCFRLKEHKCEEIRQESGAKLPRITENNLGLVYFGGFKELIKG